MEQGKRKGEGIALAVPSRPKYQQVRDRFHTEIRSGRFAPGQLFPTEAEWVETLGVSRSTVRQALAELESEGAIIRTPGRGTFVSTEQQRKARAQLDIFALIAPRVREGFYPSLVHGFEQASAGCRHQVLISNSGNEAVRQGDLILQMIDRLVGGVALVPVTDDSTPTYQVRQLQEHQIPVVFCHRTVEGSSAPCVTWSGHEVGRRAGEALLALGHRRVAALFSHSHSKIDTAIEGMRNSFVEAGVNPRGVDVAEYGSPVILPAPEVAKAIENTLKDIFDRPNRPTAVFCFNLPDAEQVYLQAGTFGLKIPQDLSLLYFGGTWRDHGIAQRISCVAVDEHEVGCRAARLLHDMRNGKRPLDSDEQFVFPVAFLPGETMGQAG